MNLQQPLSQMDAVALDFETTGSAPGVLNMPWQIGLVVIHQGRVDMERSFQSFLRVPEEHPFNPYTPGRWAQLREELSQAPTLQELWPTLKPYLQGIPLVAHHAPTERGILAQEFPMQQFGPWVDTLTIARQAFPKQRDYKLENLIPNLGMAGIQKSRCPEGAPHDAFYDAVACGTFLETVLNAPGWNAVTLEQIASISSR